MQHRPSRRVSVPALIVFCLLALALVVLVAREQRLFYAEVVQQPQGVARVLAGYHVRIAQLFEAAQRHVPEVADGRRHYYQRHRSSSFFVRLIKFRRRL